MERASRLAARQSGTIARRQLIAVGFTPERVRSWIRGGRLHIRYPGVYAWGRPDLSTEGDHAAALLFAGRGAALGGISALWWQDLLGSRPERIHVDAPGRKASRADIVISHPGAAQPSWFRGLPVVPLPQALLSSAGDLGHNSLRLVLARAEFHHLLDLSSLPRAMGRGIAGSAVLRTAMATHLPQLATCESPLEIDFVLLCERFGIELPEPNVRIARWRPDMLWRDRSLIVELDGKDAHTTAAQIAADARREGALRALGFTVVRFGWDDVHLRPAWVAAEVRRLLGRSGG